MTDQDHTPVAGLRRYHERCRGLVGRDAQARLAELIGWYSIESRGSEHVPSAHEMMEVPVTDETRHSLALAWLLDPRRSKEIAAPFWAALIGHLHATAETPEQLKALDAWSPDHLDYMDVDPKSHGAEWGHLDVFARVVSGGEHQFGLVIETKVAEGTPERPGQLEDYFHLVEKRHDPARTAFVFLTESGRQPETAGGTVTHWQVLSWSDLERVLGMLSREDADLDYAHRRLLAQYRDIVLRDILGRRSDRQSRMEVERLSGLFAGCDPGDPIWRDHHGAICALWSDFEES